MAVDTQAPLDLQRAWSVSSWQGIRPAEGVKVFDHTLQLNRPQVAVATVDLRNISKSIESLAGDGSRHQEELQQPAQAMYERPMLSNEYVAPETDTERAIVDHFETLLGVKPVGVHDSFFELGGHSLLAIQLVSRMRDTFQTEIAVQVLFENPTVAALTALIEEGEQPAARDVDKLVEMLEVVENLSEEEVRALLEGGRDSPEG
jgi:acyl carrier protein